MEFTFSELRQARKQVLDFTQRIVPDYTLDMRTALVDDLSLEEIDGYQFLDDFQLHFKIPLPQRAYDYVCPAVLKMGFWRSIVHFIQFLFLPIWVVLLFPVWMLKRLHTPTRSQMVKEKIKQNRQQLTLADLTLTLAAKNFIKREETPINWKKSQ